MYRILIALLLAGTWAPRALAEPFVSGFVEVIQAVRVQPNDALSNGPAFEQWRYPRSDLRAQIQLSGGGDRDEYFVRLDFVSDQAYAGAAELDLREAYLKLYPSARFDLKIGRQVATWGTGDLLFANDLFAKDWVAFFTGQELSYLKPPQDLLRLAFYTGGPTVEVALSPYFTMDHLPRGERLSVYNPLTGMTVGASGSAAVDRRAKSLKNAEMFLRISGYSGGYEWALYGYRGFFPQPLGVTVKGSDTLLFAPRMSSGGASLRGSMSGYLVSFEGAFYYSEEDPDGDQRLLPNSAVKLLAGMEKSLGHEWTLGTQWFGDWMLGYDKYAEPFLTSGGEPMLDELRHTITVRLTKFLRYQTVRLNLFGYWGISDEDVYLRPSLEYSFSDALKLTFGMNWLDGNQPYTMFGQFRNNSNVYGRMRYSF